MCDRNEVQHQDPDQELSHDMGGHISLMILCYAGPWVMENSGDVNHTVDLCMCIVPICSAAAVGITTVPRHFLFCQSGFQLCF